MMFMPMMRSIFDDGFMPSFRNEGIMKTDVSEENGRYVMKIDIPGVKKDDIRLSLKDGNLTISASSDSNHEEKDKEGHVIRQERYAGSCSRSFYVGKDMKEEDIHASLKDGVLRIELPKKEDTPEVEEKHYIEIE